MMKRKVGLALCIAAICLCGFGCGGTAHSAGNGGEGATPARTIASAAELAALANSKESVKLASDIDLSAEGEWTPVEGFAGILDGDGHSITGLTINARNKGNLGLFGTLTGTVKNVTVQSENITATGDAGKAGIVAGTNKGVIQNVTVSGQIGAEYYSYVGGVAGYNDGGKIIDCVNKAAVSGVENVGGIAGYSTIPSDGVIDGNVNEGSVTGSSAVGGIAGRIKAPKRDKDVTYEITDEINRGAIRGTTSVGGIFGIAEGNKYSFSGTIGGLGGYSLYTYVKGSLFENYGVVTGGITGSAVGGLMGTTNNFSTLTASKNKADISGGDYVGGFVGKGAELAIKTSEENTNVITGKAYVGGFAGRAGVVEGAVNGGTVISNGIISEDDVACSYLGGIAGYCNGLVNCKNKSSIQATGAYVGGLAGYVIVYGDDKVNENENSGSVSGAGCTGGIAGYLTCPRYEETKTHMYTVGYNNNGGEVSGTTSVGGIFGRIYANYNKYYGSYYYNTFKISYCVNTAQITGSATVGGVAGSYYKLKTDDSLFATNTTVYGEVLGE